VEALREGEARHVVRRCVALLAVQPPAARLLAPMPVARAQLAVEALREGEALRGAQVLPGRGARLELLHPAYAVARLRLSPSRQKR
jgi:hypothetical protein